MRVMADEMWLGEEMQLQALVVTNEWLEVGERTYRRLEQPSLATYHGPWARRRKGSPGVTRGTSRGAIRRGPSRTASAAAHRARCRGTVSQPHGLPPPDGYLDEVVNTCEPAGDPRNMKERYRSGLMHNDDAIDRSLKHLRWRAKNTPIENQAARTALAKDISYIRKQRKTMRYASIHKQDLPIGSGATEFTCALMQCASNDREWGGRRPD